MRSRVTIFAIAHSFICLMNAHAYGGVVDAKAVVELRAAEAYEKARVCINSGHNEEAVRLFTVALSCPQKRCWAFANRGRAYLRVGRYDEAASDLADALRIADQELETHWPSAGLYEQRAWVHMVEDELQERQRGFSAGDATRPHLEQALADLTKALEFEPRRLKSLIWQAYVLYADEDWSALISMCDRILAIDSTDYARLRWLAFARLQKLDYDLAVKDSEAVLEVLPSDRWTLRVRGQAYAEKGLWYEPHLGEEAWKEGLTAHNKAIATRPDEPGLYEGRAIIYFHMGEARRALLDVEKAIKHDPEPESWNLPLAQYLVGALLLKDDLGKETLPILNRICDSAPSVGECFLMRASVHVLNMATDDAQRDYLQAEKLGFSPGSKQIGDLIRESVESAGRDSETAKNTEARVPQPVPTPHKDPAFWATATTEAPKFDPSKTAKPD